jgi:hypothetical protein
MYASVFKREQSKLGKKSAKRKKVNLPEGESDEKMSGNVIRTLKEPLSKTCRKTSNEESDVIFEEEESQKKLHWFKDHGEMIGDKGHNKGTGYFDESSSN